MKDRRIYIDKFTQQLKIWDAEINKLELKADQAKADVKRKYKQTITELLSKREGLQNKLKEMDETTNEAWDKLKQGFEKSWQDMSNAVKNAISEFK